MKTKFNKFFRFTYLLAFIASAIFVNSCKEEEVVDPPVASFQFAADETDWQIINFTSFSIGATSWSWDFGDGQTSTEENPSNTYAAAGDYTVTLTVKNAGGEHSKAETVSVVDPDALRKIITGDVSKEWIMQREGTAAVVWSPEGQFWWAFEGSALSQRPCILDDVYTFSYDGTWANNTNGTFFMDKEANGGWNDSLNPDTAGEGCVDETNPDAFNTSTGGSYPGFANGGDYTFELNDTNDEITIFGTGAYIMLPNKSNAGNLGPDGTPASSITFEIKRLAQGDVADTLHLWLQGNATDGNWDMYLVSYHDPANMPPIPADPVPGFSQAVDGSTVTFTNTSTNSVSYSWDFGDGNTSAEESPSHTYSADGFYTITLTATSSTGSTGTAKISVAINSTQATATAADFSAAAGKVWTLANVTHAYSVGPGAGDGSWWGVSLGELEVRACQLDDEFIFFDDGSFDYDSKGELWAEAFMGVTDAACTAEGSLTAPYDGFATNLTDYTFSFTDATDVDPAKITVTGTGAFLGFNKAYNGGEYSGEDVSLADAVTYNVVQIIKAADGDYVQIALDYVGDGCCYWNSWIFSPAQ